ADGSTHKAHPHNDDATDKRNTTHNSKGRICASPEDSTDFVPILDPVGNKSSEMKVPVRDPNTPDTMFIATTDTLMLAPSPYWGTERIWQSQATVHNPMFDEKGRVCVADRIRPSAIPPL